MFNNDCRLRLPSALLATFVFCAALSMMGAAPTPEKSDVVLDFSGYSSGPVEQWMRGQGWQFEKDAKDPKRLRLTIANGALSLASQGKLRGFILNDGLNLPRVGRVRITWGVGAYPKDVAYSREINNEALMVYFFFGTERISSGHILIPNSPYFIGLFLCENDLVDHPYKGRYFHAGGRFVCLGKPKPGETTTSEFDLDKAFRNYFGKPTTPGIAGIGLGVDTSASGNEGRASAFIKRIEMLDAGGH
jgi:hypothetical protein